MTDLNKMNDIEVIQHYFKVDEEMAQKLIDEGMDMNVLRGKTDVFKDTLTKEIGDITTNLKKQLKKIVDDFDI